MTLIKANTPISKTWPSHLTTTLLLLSLKNLKVSQDPKEKKEIVTSIMCKIRKMNSELNLERKSLRKDSTPKEKNFVSNKKFKKNLN